MTSKKKKQAYWQEKTPEQFTSHEWEQICDGCAKCCLIKLEDEDTGEHHQTNACCQYLDLHTCRCTDYKNRNSLVPSCIHLTPDNFRTINWLPQSCAYKLIAEEKPLPQWHHLVSGKSESIHDEDQSIQHWATPENEVDDIIDHLIDDEW